MEERCRRIFKEYTNMQKLEVQDAKNLEAGADLFHVCRVRDGVGGRLPADEAHHHRLLAQVLGTTARQSHGLLLRVHARRRHQGVLRMRVRPQE